MVRVGHNSGELPHLLRDRRSQGLDERSGGIAARPHAQPVLEPLAVV